MNKTTQHCQICTVKLVLNLKMCEEVKTKRPSSNEQMRSSPPAHKWPTSGAGCSPYACRFTSFQFCVNLIVLVTILSNLLLYDIKNLGILLLWQETFSCLFWARLIFWDFQQRFRVRSYDFVFSGLQISTTNSCITVWQF